MIFANRNKPKVRWRACALGLSLLMLPLTSQCGNKDAQRAELPAVGWLGLDQNLDLLKPVDYMSILQSSLRSVNLAIASHLTNGLSDLSLTNSLSVCDNETGYPLVVEDEPLQESGYIDDQLRMIEPQYPARFLYCQLESQESQRTVRGMQMFLDGLICSLQRDGHLNAERLDGEKREIEFGFKRSCFSRSRIDNIVEEFDTSLASLKMAAKRDTEHPIWTFHIGLSEMSWRESGEVWMIRFGIDEQRHLALNVLIKSEEGDARSSHYLLVSGPNGHLRLEWKQLGIQEEDWEEGPQHADSLEQRIVNQRFQLNMRGAINQESLRYSRVDDLQILASEVSLYQDSEASQSWRQAVVYSTEGSPSRGFYTRGFLCGDLNGEGCSSVLEPEQYQSVEFCSPANVSCGPSRGIVIDNPLLAAFAMAGAPSLDAYRLPAQDFDALTKLPVSVEVHRRDGFIAQD